MSEDQFWRIVIGSAVLAIIPLAVDWFRKHVAKWRGKTTIRR